MASASDTEEASLTPATVDMCAKAFQTILSRLRPEQSPLVSLNVPSHEGGLFVTWSVPRGRNGSYVLRGCIGTLSPAALHTAVERYAVQAAFHDPRFDPIVATELPLLKVGVSVLSGFQTADSVYDWEIGVHGLILEFGDGRYSATYLPEVCAEQGWSKEECIQSLAEKAGYRRAFTGKILDTAQITTYQSTKSELVYEEFLTLQSE